MFFFAVSNNSDLDIMLFEENVQMKRNWVKKKTSENFVDVDRNHNSPDEKIQMKM